MKSNLFKFYVPEQVDYTEPWELSDEKTKRNWNQIYKSDKTGKDNNTILGRFYSESIGDGKAIYIVTKLNKRTCVLECCTQIGDDWKIPMLGDIGTANIDYITQRISARDSMSSIFGRE